MIRMLMIGYLQGIRSERRLVEEPRLSLVLPLGLVMPGWKPDS
jgi:hypothetical protein